MQQRSLQSWLNEYAESHQNITNKRIHWVCVPSIFFSIVCFLSLIPVSDSIHLAHLSMVFVVLYYASLSKPLALGIALFYCLCLIGVWVLRLLPFPLWQLAAIIFATAWIGQFYGHKIEGKKPSFLKDIQFLLIGPAWLLSFGFTKMGVRY